MTQPFRIEPSGVSSPIRRSLLWVARPAVEKALRFASLNDIYARSTADNDGRHFADKALEVMSLTYELNRSALEAIPRQGPLVVVANHPFGGIEGMILASLLLKVRPDVKLLANEMLSRIPELRETFFFVDVFGQDAKARLGNAAAVRQSVSWVGDGHALGVFPSGAVSHLVVKHRNVADPVWNPATARIIQRTRATVVPVFFDGRNSNLFQMAGLVHPMLRSAMLPRELLKRRRSRVSVVVGNPIKFDRMAKMTDRQELTDYLRVRTYLLRPRQTSEAFGAPPSEAGYQPIVAPESPAYLAAEVAAIPKAQVLLSCGDYDVLYARPRQMDSLMREIGRLREIAFRLVGEGTGRSLDLDRFDQHYVHLIVWNRVSAEIVGCYRMGPTDEILSGHGKDGLYTSTLFKYRKKLIRQMGPALELGRSFVHPDYQRGFQPLQLLWKGIAGYACRFPRYRYLFGPVSISAQYSSMSKEVLMACLEANRFLPSLAKQIRAKNPPRKHRVRDWDPAAFSTVASDLEEVNRVIADMEADGKPMPVLLRQYLKLNAQCLGFNVDPEFGNVLDGLMLIDMTKLPEAIGGRYFGRPAWQTFVQSHAAG